VTKRILFIDDELELWENALREELRGFGFEVIGLEDPVDALELIASYKPDVVLLDILFPDGYLGKPTLVNIKKKFPNLPVMMITSTMDKSEYKAADYTKADYRYAKAALAEGDFSDLASQLNRLLEKTKTTKFEGEGDIGLDRFGFIIGKTKAMQEVAEMVEKVADQDHTVLITGESGTGKELIARSIHIESDRRKHNFLTIVCPALPKDLLESELFGHEKGAFTGAISQKVGKFELAGDGTIFLDEIGEIPIDTQVKLLRFLQEKEFEHVGGNTTLTSDARIIAATNQDLKELIKKGKFREDLYFRLNVVSIHTPALKERKEDISLFFTHFIKKANKDSKKKVLPILREDVKDLFLSYTWPGNIRELENLIKRAVALSDENILQVSNFPDLYEREDSDELMVSDPSSLPKFAGRLYTGELTWQDLASEFGPKGAIRREILLITIRRFIEEHGRRPTSRQLSDLLNLSPNNMRQILLKNRIELTKINH